MSTSSDPDRIRADIEQTRSELSCDVDALTDRVSPARIAERQTDKVKNAVNDVKDKVFGSTGGHGDAKPRGTDGSGAGLAEMPHRVTDTAAGNPWAAGLIAFGVGLLAASLIPSTRQEQDLVSRAKSSDAVKQATEEAKSVARDVGENLKQPAQEAADAVKQTATDGAQEVKKTAAEGVDDVRATGQHAAQDVRADAEQSRERLQGS